MHKSVLSAAKLLTSWTIALRFYGGLSVAHFIGKLVEFHGRFRSADRNMECNRLGLCRSVVAAAVWLWGLVEYVATRRGRQIRLAGPAWQRRCSMPTSSVAARQGRTLPACVLR